MGDILIEATPSGIPKRELKDRLIVLSIATISSRIPKRELKAPHDPPPLFDRAENPEKGVERRRSPGG